MLYIYLVDKAGSTLIQLDIYKVLILNEPGLPSVGEKITRQPSPGKGLKSWLEWKPKENSPVTVNLLEITAGLVCSLNCQHI